MKVEVTFREYEPPDPDGERGDFLGSFKMEISGRNLDEVVDAAGQKAKELSAESGNDVRVFAIPLDNIRS